MEHDDTYYLWVMRYVELLGQFVMFGISVGFLWSSVDTINFVWTSLERH